jgi:hypothetical protein
MTRDSAIGRPTTPTSLTCGGGRSAVPGGGSAPRKASATSTWAGGEGAQRVCEAE